jgi:hypothetical protein
VLAYHAGDPGSKPSTEKKIKKEMCVCLYIIFFCILSMENKIFKNTAVK